MARKESTVRSRKASPGSHGGGPGYGKGAPKDKTPKPPTYQIVATGEAAKNFNFVALRPPGKKTNTIESIGHLVKSCLGGGVISIHAAYMSCGLWTAIILNIILGFLVTYLMVVLAQSAQRTYGRTGVHTMSYPDLAEATLDICKFPKLRKWSKAFRYCVDVTIMLDLFGSCCCYQVIIATSVQEALQIFFDKHLSKRTIIAILIPFCIVICMILTLKYLAPFSIVADIIIIAIAFATVYYGSVSASKSPLEYAAFKNITGLLQFIGVCVFSMEGVGVTLPIENNMKEPKKVTVVLSSGMALVVILVMTVGFFGYWGFGENALAPVTVNFPQESIVSKVLKTSLIFMVYVTFALNFWIPFDLTWHYIKQRHNPERYWISERVWRTILVLLISFISLVFPVITDLMGVIGAFCLSNMGFIYPAFIQLILDFDDPGLGAGKWRLWRFIAIFIFALMVMIIGTASNVIELVKSSLKSD